MFDQSELKSHPEADNESLPESGTELERVKGGGPLQVKDREAGTQKQEVTAKARGRCQGVLASKYIIFTLIFPVGQHLS